MEKIDFLHPKSHWRFWYGSASGSVPKCHKSGTLGNMIRDVYPDSRYGFFYIPRSGLRWKSTGSPIRNTGNTNQYVWRSCCASRSRSALEPDSLSYGITDVDSESVSGFWLAKQQQQKRHFRFEELDVFLEVWRLLLMLVNNAVRSTSESGSGYNKDDDQIRKSRCYSIFIISISLKEKSP